MIQGGRGVIRTFLEKRGYRSVPEDFYGKIEEWKDGTSMELIRCTHALSTTERL